MRPEHRETLRALGVEMPEPEATPPQARDQATGRFAATEPGALGVSLDGGFRTPPPPAARTNAEILADHSQLLAFMAQAPRLLPNLARVP